MGLLLAMSTTSRADELSRSDKLRLLYSNQLSFDRRGVPLITIGIADGQREAVIESTTPIRLLPDGEDGSEVQVGKRWRVTLSEAKAAEIEHYAVLAREGPSGLERLTAQLKTWQGRGVRCRILEVGTIFGVRGKVYDNRAYILADGPYGIEAEATATAERHATRYGVTPIDVLAQLKTRPSGRLEAADEQGTTRVRVRDALWLAPTGKGLLGLRLGRAPAAAYWGQIYVTVDRNGRLAVVNAVPADKLLAGLVPAEIFPTAPKAALMAQAVAARGDLMAKLGTRHLVDPFRICARQHCQVYRGAGHEHPHTTDAVQKTEGQVLVRPDASLVNTVYHAACGGHTEDNDRVWPVRADAHLRGHLDGDAKGSPFGGGITEENLSAWLATRPRTHCGGSTYNQEKYRWTVRLPLEELTRLVQALGVGPVRAIQVLERGRSGRARRVRVEGALGRKEVRGELTIRQLFGGLRSSMFVVTPERDAGGRVLAFVFKGGGWGHGVGMCQTGATGMARSGRPFAEILRHYYPGSELVRLY